MSDMTVCLGTKEELDAICMAEFGVDFATMFRRMREREAKETKEREARELKAKEIEAKELKKRKIEEIKAYLNEEIEETDSRLQELCTSLDGTYDREDYGNYRVVNNKYERLKLTLELVEVGSREHFYD